MRTPTIVRPPAVAGLFYPADRATLTRDVDGFLDAGRPAHPPLPVSPRALVAPHAGYAYSGPVAGSAYRTWRGLAGVTRVLLLGPAHRWPLDGMAAPSVTALATPLGDVPVDPDGVALALRASAWVAIDDRPHAGEHSLEVQLPFLQRVLAGVPVVPLVVGRVAAREVAAVVTALVADPGTVVVVSTDLSHYLPHERAEEVDRLTVARVVARAAEELADRDACGAYPLRGLLTAARTLGWSVRALDRRTSADTAGTPERVVGYGAFAVLPGPDVAADPSPAAASVGTGGAPGRGVPGSSVGGPPGPVAQSAADRDPGARPEYDSELERELSPDDELALLDLAIGAILQEFRTGRRPRLAVAALPPRLARPGAAFVTLTRNGRLLGCIGTLQAYRPLAVDVAEHACDAAFADPRMPPIRLADAAAMDVEISVLTVPAPLPVGGYDDLVRLLVPNRDGVVATAPGRRATLLPAVWEDLPDPAAFVAVLWRKAGLPPRSWPEGIEVSTYRTRRFADHGPRVLPE